MTIGWVLFRGLGWMDIGCFCLLGDGGLFYLRSNGRGGVSESLSGRAWRGGTG